MAQERSRGVSDERGHPPLLGATGLQRFFWLAIFGFLLHGNWEWLQTPFYDDGGVGLNTVVWYRFHCTLFDVAILLGCAAVVSAAERGTRWLKRPGARHLAALAFLGIAYTALSEQINVGLLHRWAYSHLMPLIPGTTIGVVPIVQWLVLPAAAAWLASRVQ